MLPLHEPTLNSRTADAEVRLQIRQHSSVDSLLQRAKVIDIADECF